MRAQAGQPHPPAHNKKHKRKPKPPAAAEEAGKGKDAVPPVRDPAQGLWSDAAVAWTRAEMGARTEAEEAALTWVVLLLGASGVVPGVVGG